MPLSPSNFAEWLPVSVTAPAEEEIELCVMDYDEIVVPLPYPCHRSGPDFVDASNKRRIDIQPTHWRRWSERRA